MKSQISSMERGDLIEDNKRKKNDKIITQNLRN